MNKHEQWLTIPGYGCVYEVSNLGRVRSVDRILIYQDRGEFVKRPLKGRILKQSGYKYKVVKLKYKTPSKRVHSLVARAFLTKPIGKTQINHKNGNRHDNRLENLEWVTPLENVRHAISIGMFKHNQQARKLFTT